MTFKHRIAIVALAATATTAHAATFTSETAFATAVPGVTIEDFGTYATGTLVANGGTLGGLTYGFATTGGLGGVISNQYNTRSGESLAAKQVAGPIDPLDFFYGGDAFTVTFASAVKAVGILVNVNLPFGATLTTTSGTAAATYATYDSDTFTFLGLTSATPFTSATFVSSVPLSGSYNVVAIEYGDTVPEPAAWMLLIAGFGLTGTALRRRAAVAA